MKLSDIGNGSHYLYRHRRASDGTPIYIGIGTKRKKYSTYEGEYARAYRFCDRSNHWKNVFYKHGVLVDILLESDSVEFIKQKEIEFIKIYGRLDNLTGTLVNKTDGGDGTTGRIYVVSDETRAKMRGRMIGRKISAEHLRKLNDGRRNTIVTKEQRLAISKRMSGRKLSEEHIAKNRYARLLGKNFNAKRVINNSTGEVYSCIKEASIATGINYLKIIRYLSGITKKTREHEIVSQLSFI